MRCVGGVEGTKKKKHFLPFLLRGSSTVKRHCLMSFNERPAISLGKARALASFPSCWQLLLRNFIRGWTAALVTWGMVLIRISISVVCCKHWEVQCDFLRKLAAWTGSGVLDPKMPSIWILIHSAVFLRSDFYLSHLCWAEEIAGSLRSREWKETRSSDEENTLHRAGRRKRWRHGSHCWEYHLAKWCRSCT